MQRVQEVSLRFCGQLLSTAAKQATQSDAHLDLILPKVEELVRDVKTSVIPGCSDHEIAVSQIPWEMGKETSSAQTLDIRE